MKPAFYTLALFFISWSVYGQSFVWIDDDNVNYNLNPNFTEFALELDEVNNRVYSVSLEIDHEVLGLKTYGELEIEARDLSGNDIWSFELGEKVYIPAIQTDGSGNLYIAGAFLDSLVFGPGNVLVNTGGAFNIDYFLAKYDVSGNFVWSRNLSASMPGITSIDDLDMDLNGNVWYAVTTFSGKRFSHITQIDVNGNDVQTRTIENSAGIGSIDFDDWGGLYVSGDASLGIFVIGGDTANVPFGYSIFLARYNSQGDAWVKFAHAITTVRARSVADVFGNVFISGSRFDSLSFGGIHVPPHNWVTDHFVFKADSNGVFQWGLPGPPQPNVPLGEFWVGRGFHSGVDASGNFYIYGTQRGYVDWNNGFGTATTSGGNSELCFVKFDPNGLTQYVKLTGHHIQNFAHSIEIADNGDCYFTSFSNDSAYFDNFFVNTGSLRSFVIGKLASTNTVGLNEVSQTGSFIKNNPSDGVLFLDHELIGSTLQVFSAHGKLIYREHSMAASVIDLTHLDNGIYFIRTIRNGEYSSERWMKIR